MVANNMSSDLRESNVPRTRGVDLDKQKAASEVSHWLPAETTLRERRREPRYPCNDRAEVRHLPEGRFVPATVLDISRSGVGYRTLGAAR